MKTKDTPVKIGVEVEATRYAGFYSHDHECAKINGWQAGYDGDLEFRFAGPADTLQDAFDRCDALGAHMAGRFTSRSFAGQGTHIHLGVSKWLHDNFGESCANDKHTGFLFGYFLTRHKALWDIIPSWRNGFGYCRTTNVTTALHQLHNHLATEGAYRYVRDQDYPAIAPYRRGHPTFEVRMFPGTNNLNVVKGYIAILVSMMKGAEKAMLDLDWRAVKAIPPERIHRPLITSDILVNQQTYSLDDLKEEVEETGFMVDPLLDWIDRTHKKRGRLESFYPDMSEITGTQAAPQSLQVAA